MEFFIKQNATLPVLKMQVINDGRSDYMRFMKSLEVSSIFFTMINVDTGIPKIVSAACEIVSLKLADGATPEYYIFYKFKKRDTNKSGRYQGQFIVKNSEGNLILPIREDLYINIEESFITECDPNEMPITPCPECPDCISNTPTPTPTPTPAPTGAFTATTCDSYINSNIWSGSGGIGFFTINIDTGNLTGTVNLTYNSFTVPDKFVVMWDGIEVINTGFVSDCYPSSCQTWDQQLTNLGYPPVSGPNGVMSFNKSTSTPSEVILYVEAPLAGTGWSANLECPK